MNVSLNNTGLGVLVSDLLTMYLRSYPTCIFKFSTLCLRVTPLTHVGMIYSQSRYVVSATVCI